jgi:hypothetical protein
VTLRCRANARSEYSGRLAWISVRRDWISWMISWVAPRLEAVNCIALISTHLIRQRNPAGNVFWTKCTKLTIWYTRGQSMIGQQRALPERDDLLRAERRRGDARLHEVGPVRFGIRERIRINGATRAATHYVRKT